MRRMELALDSRPAPSSHNSRDELLLGSRPMISHPASAMGARIAVSFAKAARANQNTVATVSPSTYAERAQKVSPAAAKSTCARELCAKKTGYTAVQSVDATATFMLAA